MPRLRWNATAHDDDADCLGPVCGLCQHGFRQGEFHWFPGSDYEYMASLIERGVLPAGWMDFCATCKDRIEGLLMEEV
jgi:hypothetical protein